VEFPDGSQEDGREILVDALAAVGFKVLTARCIEGGRDGEGLMVWACHPRLKGEHICRETGYKGYNTLQFWCEKAVKGRPLEEIVGETDFWGVIDTSRWARWGDAPDSFEDWSANDLAEAIDRANEEYSMWEEYAKRLKEEGVSEYGMPEPFGCEEHRGFGGYEHRRDGSEYWRGAETAGVAFLDKAGHTATTTKLITLLSQKLGMDSLGAYVPYGEPAEFVRETVWLSGLQGDAYPAWDLYDACMGVLKGEATAEEAMRGIADDLGAADDLEEALSKTGREGAKPSEKAAVKKKPKSR